ncbi:MAG: hypothetical protein AAGA85_14975 [Bacteroidota bacterium]
MIKKLRSLFGKDGSKGGGIGDIPPPSGAPDDQRIALRAMHFAPNSDKLEEIETPVEYAFPKPKGPLSNVGRPITFDTALRFIKEFVNDKEIDREDVAAVTFDKDVLMLLLSQSGCEGIRFYFGKFPDSEEMTLVLVGVDKNDNDLGTEVGPDDRKRSLFSAKPREQKLQFSQKMGYASARAAVADSAEPTLLFEIGGHLKVNEL